MFGCGTYIHVDSRCIAVIESLSDESVFRDFCSYGNETHYISCLTGVDSSVGVGSKLDV